MLQGALWGMSIFGSVVSFLSDQDAISAREAEIEREMTEQRIATYTREMQKMRRFQQISGQHLVSQGASGVTAGSFTPVNEDHFNELAKDINNEKLNLKFKEFEAANQENALEDSRVFVGAKDLFGVAEQAARKGIVSQAQQEYLSSDDFDVQRKAILTTMIYGRY